jgi:hypothetical protein
VTRSEIRNFVETSSVERIREVLDLLQKLKRHVPLSQLPQHEVPFLLDLRDHEAFFKSLADARLQGG